MIYNYEVLRLLDFKLPYIEKVTLGSLNIVKNDRGYLMYENDMLWMTLDLKDYNQVWEMYSHYKLAEGHCLCTGMGFLLRESWLLNNPKVTKLTVVEKSLDLIKYHTQYNPELIERIEVIHSDIYNYSGDCDTLLLDNFEGGTEYFASFLNGAKAIAKNITHNKLWIWPMEAIITTYCPEFIGKSLWDVYNKIKRDYELNSLPDLNEDQLMHFCTVFHQGKITT